MNTIEKNLSDKEANDLTAITNQIRKEGEFKIRIPPPTTTSKK